MKNRRAGRRKFTAVLCAMLGVVLLSFASQSSAAEVVQTSASAKCASWFARIREQLFMHYNYKNRETGIDAVSAVDYNRAWLRTTAFDIRKNRKFLNNAIRENHPQIAFLEKLGFKFDEKNGDIIPSMSEISARHEVLLKELIASGVSEKDILRPARMFELIEDGKRRIIPVGLDVEPPRGARPVTETIGAEEFLSFVAEGHWPIGEIAPVNRTEISFAFHDLGHFGSFHRNPEFMKAIKDFARNRVAEGRFGIESRMSNLIMESLSLGRRDARPAFDASLLRMKIDGRAQSEAWTVGNFKKAIAGLSDEQITQEVSEAYAIRHKLIEDFGGARSDAVGSERARFPLLVPYPDIIQNPKSLLESAYDAKTPEMKRAAFSKYLAAMDHTTRMNPTDWLTELTYKDKLSFDSKIYRYLCLSGIYSSNSIIYDKFCRLSGR